MPTFSSDGTPLYYEVHGSGPALVLIHAISVGAGMWRSQIDEFSRSHRVIVFDARGVGRSGSISGWRGVRDRMADDVVRLMDHLGEPRAAVCGVSFGGVIAQHLAVRHPGRVDSLVVVDSYSQTRPTSVGKALWLASVYAGSVSNWLPRPLLVSLMRQQYRRWPDAADHLARAVAGIRPLEAFKTRLAITLVSYTDALASASFPILAVVGEQSWPRSVRFMEELCEAVPRAMLVRIPESNDPTPLCRPEAFNDVLTAFLHDTPDGSL